ncbi:hypothetical protein PC116_g23552 [Phytophthora cactorum]|nr:hypothetical protein PC116_g23552 [Phytophthora cactorum]
MPMIHMTIVHLVTTVLREPCCTLSNQILTASVYLITLHLALDRRTKERSELGHHDGGFGGAAVAASIACLHPCRRKTIQGGQALQVVERDGYGASEAPLR